MPNSYSGGTQQTAQAKIKLQNYYDEFCQL